jgi:CRP-like cAMP-binding protein
VLVWQKMAREALDAFLAKSKIFSLLDEEGVERLARIAQQVDFAAGTEVFREGDQGDAFYCTLSGTLRVSASALLGSSKHVATLIGGSVFGEIAALSGEPRTATVTAQTDVRALKFEMVAVFNVLKDYPKVLAGLNRLGVERTEDLLVKVLEE